MDYSDSNMGVCRNISVLAIISTVSVLLWFLNIGHIQGSRPASAFLILVSYVARLLYLYYIN